MCDAHVRIYGMTHGMRRMRTSVLDMSCSMHTTILITYT